MEVIIGSVITGVVTIIGAIIVYQVKLSKILDSTIEIKSKTNDLSKEHSNLSKEHSNLSKEHSELLVINRDIKSTVSDVAKIAISEKAKQEFRYNNLTESQKSIGTSVTAITQLYEQLQLLQSQNLVLTKENVKLKELMSKQKSTYRAKVREDDFEHER